MIDNGNKDCPFCGEQIKAQAILCRFCNTNLEGNDAKQSDTKSTGKQINSWTNTLLKTVNEASDRAKSEYETFKESDTAKNIAGKTSDFTNKISQIKKSSLDKKNLSGQPVSEETETGLHNAEYSSDNICSKGSNIIRNDIALASEENCLFYLDGGVGDIIEVYKDKLIIMHKGAMNFLAMGLKGDKMILLSDITSVQFKKAALLAGYLQFSLPGGKENTGGMFGAVGDENTITIKGERDNNEVALKIKSYIEEYRIALIRQPSVQHAENNISVADELLKYKQLLDAEIITQEEFNQQKKKLLS